MRKPDLFLAVLLSAAAIAVRPAAAYTVTNITRTLFSNEVVRLPVAVPDGVFRVLEDGREIASVTDTVEGESRVYVRTTIAPGESRRYELQKGAKPGAFKPAVSVKTEGGRIVLDGGAFAVRLPAAAAAGEAPAPIEAVRLNGQWVGGGAWQTPMRMKAFTATVIDDGRVMGKVRLHYEFDGMAGLRDDLPAYADIDVTVMPDRPFAVIEERHEMARGSAWTFTCTQGWEATNGWVKAYGNSFGGGRRASNGRCTLEPGQVSYQPPGLLLNLFPRWNQHYKDGWFCAAINDTHMLGALTVLAGRWYWPHENSIRCLVGDGADTLTFACPTRRGMRYWMLVAGGKDLIYATERFTDRKGNQKTRVIDRIQHVARRYGYEALDTIINDIPILEWEGRTGGYRGYWPLANHINPTSTVRGWGQRSLGQAHAISESLTELIFMQVLASPHTYGSYWNYWSPENPNFFTDFNKINIGMACRFRTHPRYKEIARMALQKFREDVYHSIALPSGSGNECPGYQQYALKHYRDIATVLANHTDEDPMTWPRIKAAARFIVRLSAPLGEGKRGSHPGGDTHGNYVFGDPRKVAREFGVDEDVQRFRTEELQGFGAVFRDRCGTEDELYLAFKSGPARGHFHGDQLSFHLCANARPLAIDHHCSYNPHAAQEHMHNRVAFFTEQFPHANMDGFERLIAFKSAGTVDAAVGQVESLRLRKMRPYPPARWHGEYPQTPLASPLVYRRTLVMVRARPLPYVVIRDQYAGPVSLNAAYCLHAYGNDISRRDRTFEFGKLAVFCAAPETFEVSRHDWKKYKTLGLRLTTSGASGTFITVLVPHPEPDAQTGATAALPAMSAIEGGVKVGDDEIRFDGGIDDEDAVTYVSVRTGGGDTLTLTGKDIDLNRSQGEIGLFVPDAGYPFGEIPNWLRLQRATVPDWAPDWARKLRSRRQ